MQLARSTRRPTWIASGSVGLLTGALVFGLVALTGIVVESAPANAADSSAVTLTAAEQDHDLEHAPFPDLAVTVSQTQDLVAQGIRVSWTGGKKSTAPTAGSNGGTNFLQIFMCWGEDEQNPGRPDRTTCMYGGANSPGSTRDAYRNMSLDAIPAEDQAFSAPSAVSFLPPYTGIPFVARDGSRVDGVTTDPTTGAKSIDGTVNLNINPYFTANTTNEIPWVGSGNDGKGSVSFEVQTASQAPALGCGEAATSGGVTTGASCWLVILPRGVSDNGAANITQSGLFIESWKHALAVELDFEPVGSRCPVGAAERQLAGSELAALAVNSWQPAVCNQEGGSVYSLLTMPESDAVTAAATTVDAPLALTSNPLDLEGSDDPLKYAPIALTGVTISVAIDRRPNPFLELPDAYTDAARSPFTTVNLTPRLLAKLLSYSYLSALPNGTDTSYLDGTNLDTITKDPDFLAVNDVEWAAQDLAGPAIADVIVPQGRSDAARAVWAYIAADEDARDFMAGEPDPWGMVVNPYYSTDAAKNPSGYAFDLDRDDFPKADPVEATPANQGPINLVTWRPYANDLGTVAYLSLRGDGLLLGGWDPYSFPAKYTKGARMLPGNQALLGLTSTADAARYQVVTASLQNPSGKFVDPTNRSMLAAAEAMTANGESTTVLEFDPESTTAQTAGGAYPLTLPVYAAANPYGAGPELRTAYAKFIRYAAGTDGQTPGVETGRLPAGYAPIPAAWAQAADAAADAIEKGPVSTQQPSTGTGTNTGTSSSGSPLGGSTASSGSNGITPTVGGGGAAEQQPVASGAVSPSLNGSTTPVDPTTATSYVVPISLLAGTASAIVTLIVARRRPIRTWVRR
ncbi:hypothetical protein [Agromyces seonyuensis]|uniref:Uncharacterized protein n=1 Tax=Agromyces seonyuensis TaxID=2662446 RepID=A0A6I4NU18_9MICO|nr:hypothetical protein [Agromyces seonyuensis]MWB97878.1 hypothetical protein [Agromyces seonyuensis]